MLDGILKTGFSSKCKSIMKAIRTRIEVVRKRAEAKQRFLKEDLAKLLANGLDINAYGRTEEFIAGLNLLSCYGFIEYSCDYLVKQLSIIQKQRECPEEFREPVASLMFAAARFSDLPELRDLRDLFQERYGSSLQCYVNQKFVELLSSKPPSFEKRLQLLKDVTLEFSINWDSRGFEQRMASPSAVAQVLSPKHEPSGATANIFHVMDGSVGVSKPDKHKETWGFGKDSYNIQNGREGEKLGREELGHNFDARKERSSKGHRFPTDKEKMKETTARRTKDEKLLEARQDVTVDKPRSSSKTDDSLFRAVSPSHRKQQDNAGGRNSSQEDKISSIQQDENLRALSHRKNRASPHREVFLGENDDISYAREHVRTNNLRSPKRIDTGEEEDRSKSDHNALLPPPYVKPKNSVIPPPYVRSKDSKHKSVRKSEQASSDYNGVSAGAKSLDTGNERDRSHSIQKKPGSVGDDGLDHVHLTEVYYQDDHTLRKHRSSRKKHHKTSSVEDAEAAKKSSSSRRRESSRKGLQTLLDDEPSAKYDDERVIDKLLLHYSKKPSTCDVKKLRKEFKANRHHDDGESSQARKNDGNHLSLEENIAAPTRSKSLPREETFSSEHKKVYTRVNSFQPDGQVKHVHPKLPNYDDLAARFAALKGL